MSQALPVRTMVAGADKTFTEQVVSAADGKTPSTAYLGTDLLVGKISTGPDEPTLFIPPVIWIDATIAEFAITVSNANSTGREGIYLMQVNANRGSSSPCIFNGLLEILPSTGTEALPTVYITPRDLEEYVPAIQQYYNGKIHSVGFLHQRSLAREWIEDLLFRHYRGGMGITSSVYPQGYPYRYLGRAPELQKWLDNNNLWVTKPIREAQAYYTASIIFGGLTPSNPELFQKLQQQYQERADRVVRGITAECTSDGTNAGVRYCLIDLGATEVYRG